MQEIDVLNVLLFYLEKHQNAFGGRAGSAGPAGGAY